MKTRNYSIIVPVYNVSDGLIRCVDSIYESGLEDFEIILVNDGSTDDSLEICRFLRKKYKEIVLINQKNEGVSSARNNGIRIATGEYILFVDADDTLEANCFTNLKSLVSDKIDVIVYGISFDYYFKDVCYRKDKIIYPDGGYQLNDQWGKKLCEMYDYNVLSPVWNKVYKKSIIDRFDVEFDKDMILLEDFVFTIRYLSHCKSVYFMNSIGYHYRQAQDEMNAFRRLSKISDINQMAEYIEKELYSANRIINGNDKDAETIVKKIIYRIYYMLIEQKTYYLNTDRLKECSKEVVNSHYLNDELICLLGKRQYHLYRNLIQGHLLRIRVLNTYLQVKHKIAVWLKYYHQKNLS